jgi:cytoskeletal protein CcmA (bactofilin family)
MFKKPTPPEPLPSPGPTPARRFTDTVETAANAVGRETHLRGELTAAGPLDVAGTIDGPCRVGGLCRIREGARITGDVTATSIVVEGEMTGRTLVAENVEIGHSARVQADIRAHKVAIAEGGFLQGHVEMEDPKASPGPVTFKEKRESREPGPIPIGVARG